VTADAGAGTYRRVILRNGIPIGVAPNIEVSLVCTPDDTRYLAPPGMRSRLYELRLSLMRHVAQPVFAQRLQPKC